METLINDYRTPGHPSAFSAPATLARHAGVSKNKAKKALEHVDSYVFHREYKRPRSFNPYYIYEKRKLIQADLIDISRISNENDGVKHLFLLIDVFTRKVWVFPLQNKNARTVKNALTNWTSLLGQELPEVIQVDGGKEFWNALVRDFLRNKRITLQLAVGTSKAAYAERANKSIQILIYKYLTDRETLRYIDELQNLILTYNSRGHRSLNYMSPDEAERNENQNQVRAIAINRFQKIKPKLPKFEIGDLVRVKTDAKKITDATRAYAEQFKGEYFTIHEINDILPIPLLY